MNTDENGLKGKTVLVTGAGRGIGLAMAQALASAGAAVAIQDIDLPTAQAEVDKINAAGGKAIALGGDLTDLSLADRLVADTLQAFSSLDILINNGAIQINKHWLEDSLEDIRRQFDADLVMPMLLCQRVAPLMKARKWGRIINISSVQQRGGNPWMLPYSLSKAALDKLTKGLARELAKDQITVNTIAPGWINTYRNRQSFKSPEDVAKGGTHVPIGRIGEPSDFTGITLLLCGTGGNYITGQTIFVDGGLSAG